MLAVEYLLIGSPMLDRSKVMAQTKKGYPGCPGWGLGVEQTTSPCKKVLFGNLMTKN